MKKLLFLVCTLVILLTAASAFADTTTYTGQVTSPIVIDQPGEHTIVLDGATIPFEFSAVSLKAPATKLTVILKDGTESTMEGYDSDQCHAFCGGIYLDNPAGEVVIRCERAGEGHECDDRCGKLTLQSISTGYDADMSGSITISGGNLTFVDAFDRGASIGSGEDGDMSGTITISGGNLTFESGDLGASIGSGKDGEMSGTITISGGNHTFESSSWGASIGSGEDGDMSGAINIIGGNLTLEFGSSIGSGENGEMSGAITISRSNLTIDNFANVVFGHGTNGKTSGTIDISDSSILFICLAADLRIDPFTVSNTTFYWSAYGDDDCILKFSGDDVACGQLFMDIYHTTIVSDSGPALRFSDNAFLSVDPTDSWIPLVEVTEGTSKKDDVPLEGSPYHTYTNLKPLLGGMPYVEFRPGDFPDPEDPSPTPTVPQTGDGMNVALIALIAFISLAGAAVLRRQRRA